MAVGLCLLLPAAMAHNTSGGRLGGVNGGVSGTYVGPAGPAVGNSQISTYTAPLYAMACNLESASGGGALDETVVDGSASPSGTVPDGTWDDGGYGGACHDSSSPGCLTGWQVFGLDANLFDVFLAAACDWKTDLGGDSTGFALSFCTANSALAFSPQAILGPPTPNLVGFVTEVQPFVDCGLESINCLLDPTCGVTGATQVCGADGVIDAQNYGFGGAQSASYPAIFPVSTGVVNPPPNVTGPCGPWGEIAGVYVLSFVDMYSGNVNAYTPTTGWIDTPFVPCCGGGPGSSGGTMGHR